MYVCLINHEREKFDSILLRPIVNCQFYAVFEDLSRQSLNNDNHIPYV